MIVYIADTSEPDEKIIELMKSALPEQRRMQMAKLKKPSDRVNSAVAAYLVFYALVKNQSNEGLVYPETDSLLESRDEISELAARLGWPTEHGKPFPSGIEVNGRHYHVNISHSERLVGAAISDRPVGIDIQRIPRISISRLERIACRFHALELERLKGMPKNRYAAEFCRLWVCKESVLKLCGKGLSVPLSSFCITENDTCIIDGNTVKITVYELPDAYLAVSKY
ncbi:MAG: 4'-phosphopantetheinyl transferase superfamily protein [Oscillospiraceae bacterium]|nr:4'-phosphopantetheinyl transferase superfamily protein [Oscillospiraceae bacterium]MDD4413001.1 4'-phosphopantetheinyl transferase superfamily protein [Oscillospiraceae bacterium]